jgi:hypothetical protein
MKKRQLDNKLPLSSEAATLIGSLIAIGMVLAAGAIGQSSPLILASNQTAPGDSASTAVADIAPHSRLTAIPLSTPAAMPTNTPTSTATPTPTPIRPTATPTNSPTATPTPTPTLDLAKCNAAGCGLAAAPLPTVEYDPDLLLRFETPVRRICPECPPNEQLSAAELDALIGADPATLARLRTMAVSQITHEIAPGVVYIVFDNVHHVVVDLEEPGFLLRNIIPDTSERGTLISPSYCLSPQSLVVIDADYHGLNGSNKTETGRDLFFHLGRAALFEREGQFDIDVIRERVDYDPTTISWGGGPIFVWEGEYNFNPEQEWFEPEDLEYYRDTRWAKMSVALSTDRKYLFITASYGLTLKEHAENIIRLGQRWGIDIDRAMRFDGGESTYLAIRLGDYQVPVLSLEEPLIVNCLAIETLK